MANFTIRSRRGRKDKEKQPVGRILSNNLLMLNYIRKYVPGLAVWEIVMKVFSGIIGTLDVVYVAKFVLDGAQKHRSFHEMAPFLIGVILLNFFYALLNGYYEGCYKPQKGETLCGKMYSELFEKARNVELAAYDNPEFYNDFVWAIGGAQDNALGVLMNVGNFLSSLTKIVGTAAIVASTDSIGIWMAVVILVVTSLVRKKAIVLRYTMNQKQKPLQRKRDYTSRVLYQPPFAKEVRLSNVKEKLTSNFVESNGELIQVLRTYGRKLMLLDGLNWSFLWPVLYYGVYMGYLLYATLGLGLYTYGGFYALFKGTDNLVDNFDLLFEQLYSFTEKSLYIEKFRSFLEYKPKMAQIENPKKMPSESKELSLKNVSFTYQGCEEPTLKNINLTVKPGEKIALVGYNGAGKTTLIKLLMRLYEVSDGVIALDGQDIREYELEDFRRYFGVVFQDYQLLAATVGENVMMDLVQDSDEPVILDALEKSGFRKRLESLEDGTRTHLTREFREKGVNLSGGEGQKVAIARVFPRNCKIVILDEPSSALDPISEYNVNQSMLAAAKDKTVIFISHRLSTTRVADRIIMLEKGQIIEEGSHAELMELNGKYAEMFNMQASKYQGENSNEKCG